MKNTLKNIAILAFFGITITSCTPNDPTDGNPNGGNKEALDLISIKSTNMPTGNSCNLWDLNTSSSNTPIGFTTLRTGDFITSPAGLLGQTTMSYNTSAWDKVNKKYAVAINESLTIYDLSTGIASAPTTVIDNVRSIEYVAGTLYAIHNNNLEKLVGGSFVSLATPITLSIGTGNEISSMSTNGSRLFFIIGNVMYEYATNGTLANTTLLSGNHYDGVEFNSTDNNIYAIKKHAYPATQDELVRIIPGGSETSIYTFTYATDYSKATTAYDYNTRKYIIFSSNGHSSNSNTVTTVSNLTTTPVATSVGSSQYIFGLQIKD